MSITPSDPVTRRTFLTTIAVAEGAGLFTAVEAVASTALALGWDLDEVRSWEEWWTIHREESRRRQDR